jgi:UDP-N-acetylglucosamine 4,6-dehydratase
MTFGLGQDGGVDLSGATILLTGGTGSFGTAFTQRIIRDHPDTTLRIFSRDELKQSEMAARFGGADQLRFFIGDIRNRSRLTRAMQGADVVVHAAAMKQVPACEYNPFEAVQTNILGAQHVVDAAIDSGVERVVALSTDKAVNPVNIYGATKLCAEKIFVQGNAYAARTHTRFSCVRYGNVVGSRGSVIPLFWAQLAEGRLTITDERMTRFWITLDEAVDLVLFALANSQGGEIFVPKIPSTRVVDLAEAIAPGIPVDLVGIRPGEKLHELLLTSDESRHAVEMDDRYVVLPEHPWWTSSSPWAAGRPLQEGFVYSSETNAQWLDADQIRTLLG